MAASACSYCESAREALAEIFDEFMFADGTKLYQLNGQLIGASDDWLAFGCGVAMAGRLGIDVS